MVAIFLLQIYSNIAIHFITLHICSSVFVVPCFFTYNPIEQSYFRTLFHYTVKGAFTAPLLEQLNIGIIYL